MAPPPLGLAEDLARPLQVATGKLVVLVYNLLGSSASLQAGHLRIADASVRISDVSFGLPMAMSLLLIGYGFVFGYPLRPVVRLIVILISPLTAVICSAAAVLCTFWLYGDLTREIADVWLRISEWLMLLVAFLLLSLSVRLLNWASVPVRRYPLAYDG